MWLAGPTQHPARPLLASTDPRYQPGTFMACFSDLWRCGYYIISVLVLRLQCCAGRCVEADTGRAPATDPGCGAGRCQEARRGLCAIPPRREDRRPAPCPAHGEGNMLLLVTLITSPHDHDRRLGRDQPKHRGQSSVSWRSAWRGQLLSTQPYLHTYI